MQIEEPYINYSASVINEKLKSCKHLFNSSANVFAAFKTLGELEAKRIEQFSVISSFLANFYNSTCSQKTFVDDLKLNVQIEILRLQQQVDFYALMSRFPLEIKESMKDLQQLSPNVDKAMERQAHYIKKIAKLEADKVGVESKDGAQSKKEKERLARNYKKKEKAIKDVCSVVVDFDREYDKVLQRRFDIINPIIVGFIDVQNYRLPEIADRYNTLFNSRAAMMRKCGEWKYSDSELKEMLSVSDISRKSLWQNSVAPYKTKPSNSVKNLFKRPKSISALNGYSTMRKSSQDRHMPMRTFTQTDIINTKAIEAESEVVEEYVRPKMTSFQVINDGVMIDQKIPKITDNWFMTTEVPLQFDEANAQLKFMSDIDNKDSHIGFIQKDSIIDINARLRSNGREINEQCVGFNKTLEIDAKNANFDTNAVHEVNQHKDGYTPRDPGAVSEHDMTLNSGLSNFYIDEVPNYFSNK